MFMILDAVVRKGQRIVLMLVLMRFGVGYASVMEQDSVPSNHSINGEAYSLSDTKSSVSFIVAGHLYGAHSYSLYPSPSVTYNMDVFAHSGNDFVILLGDNYRFMHRDNVSKFRKLVLDKIAHPVYNAIGNHDINGGENIFLEEDYLKEFNTVNYHKFVVNRTMLIILDTELFRNKNQRSDGSIVGEQLDFLKSSLEQYNLYDNVVLFVHKEINLIPANNFHDEIVPLLKKTLTKGKKVFVFSGDMGLNSPNVYSYSSDNITFIHTHITDRKEDKVLKVNLTRGNAPEIEVISLDNRKSEPISKYVQEKLYVGKKKTSPKGSFFHRIKKAVTSKRFLMGVFVSLIGVSMFCLFFKFRKKIK